MVFFYFKFIRYTILFQDLAIDPAHGMFSRDISVFGLDKLWIRYRNTFNCRISINYLNICLKQTFTNLLLIY